MLTFNPFTGQLDVTGTSSSAPSVPVKYILTFNNTSDWGAASGGYYTITVPVGTHGLGINLTPVVFELSGVDYIQVTVDELKVNNVGDISIRVLEIPDLRFNDKLIII